MEVDGMAPWEDAFPLRTGGELHEIMLEGG